MGRAATRSLAALAHREAGLGHWDRCSGLLQQFCELVIPLGTDKENNPSLSPNPSRALEIPYKWLQSSVKVLQGLKVMFLAKITSTQFFEKVFDGVF